MRRALWESAVGERCGRAEGRAEGIAEGIAEGSEKTKILIRLVIAGVLS